MSSGATSCAFVYKYLELVSTEKRVKKGKKKHALEKNSWKSCRVDKKLYTHRFKKTNKTQAWHMGTATCKTGSLWEPAG